MLAKVSRNMNYVNFPVEIQFYQDIKAVKKEIQRQLDN